MINSTEKKGITLPLQKKHDRFHFTGRNLTNFEDIISIDVDILNFY